jgi:chorismate mutase
MTSDPSSGASPPTALPTLDDLRREIDAIDAQMHTLLMQRGAIIDRLIAVKKTQETGSAFRPAREAAMMQLIAERHRGILPLDTVESIWRVIIATFTYVQSPFSVHADLSAGDALMRDSARFHFGFTVPFVPHMSANGALDALQAAPGDLALISLSNRGQAWWARLEQAGAPKIIARLPFIERDDHPAAMPVFVVSRVAAEAMATEIDVWSLHVANWNATVARALSPQADLIAVPDAANDGAALLVSIPRGQIDTMKATLTNAGASVRKAHLVGSHARRHTVPSSAASSHVTNHSAQAG